MTYPTLGDSVLTDIESRPGAKDWTDSVKQTRRHGVLGVVTAFHEFYYDVRHDDGTEGFYHPHELKQVPRHELPFNGQLLALVLKDRIRALVDTVHSYCEESESEHEFATVQAWIRGYTKATQDILKLISTLEEVKDLEEEDVGF